MIDEELRKPNPAQTNSQNASHLHAAGQNISLTSLFSFPGFLLFIEHLSCLWKEEKKRRKGGI